MLRRLAGLATALAIALPGAAMAQSKVTRMIVAFPPGGPVDIVARLIADPMAKDLGHSVIVENKPGGNTIIAAEGVARSPADGSVVFLSSMTTVVLNAKLYDKLPYDPVADFAPISLVVSSPTVLVVHPSKDWADANAVVAASKAAAQPIAFASAGVGGTTHIALELFAQATGAKTLHVPYKGAAPALQDLIANQTGAFFGDLPGLIGHVRSGKLKALGVLSKSQSPQLPGVKTMAEQGIKEVEMENWYGLFAPAKTPADIVQKLNKAVHAALADPGVKAKLGDIGAQIIASTPEALAKAQKDDGDRYGAIIKAKNIKVE
jgi:tripartite-type tricarboxylate transporter receptor subunit TctC